MARLFVSGACEYDVLNFDLRHELNGNCAGPDISVYPFHYLARQYQLLFLMVLD